MTVSTEVDHNEYTGNGVTTSFPYTFRIFKKSDLVVQVVDLDENIAVLALDTDYTVTGAGGYNGGNVILSKALANGYQISISRDLPVTQETDLRNQGKFFAEVHEDAFDKLTMLIQQVRSWFRLALCKPSSIANWYDALNNYIRNLKDPRDPQDAATKNYVDTIVFSNLSRTLRVPEPINQLPPAAVRRNMMPAFDNDGNAIVVIPPSGSASDVLIQLASSSDGKGDALVAVKQPYANSVTITQHQHNAYLLTPYHFGAKGDGIADDTLALNRWSNCGAKVLYWPAGKYLVSPTNGVSLDMDNYHTGDSALTACVTVPYGVKIYTAGTETQLCVKDADSASSVGLAVSYPESSYSQGETDIGKFMIRLENGNGRYGILTPLRGEMFTAHRAKFKLGAHFGPQQGRDDLTVLQYSWVNGMLIGDAFSGSVHITGYGSYNVQQVEGTQFQCVAVKMKSVRGNVGVDIRFNTNNWWKFVELSDGVEGFVVKDSEGLGAFVGIDLTNPASEPGGFIDNVHVNVKQNGVRARNRPSLQIGNIEVYKSDGFATDLVYDAVLLVDCQEVTINSIHAIVGNSITNAQSVVNSTNSTFRLNSYFAQNIRFVDFVVNSPDCYVGEGTINQVEAVHSLSGSQSNDFHGSDVLVRSYRNNVRPLYAVMDSAFNRARARFPQNTSLQVRTFLDHTVAAAGTLTIEPRLDPSRYYIIMSAGTGAFTYSIELDKVSAVVGDIVYIKIAGSSSANPTVLVKNGIGGTTLSTFNNIGPIRLNCAYRFNESGNWVAYYITQSVETSYG